VRGLDIASKYHHPRTTSTIQHGSFLDDQEFLFLPQAGADMTAGVLKE
jgi:hypothetical protein